MKHISEVLARVLEQIDYQFTVTRVCLPEDVQVEQRNKWMTFAAGWHEVGNHEDDMMTALTAIHLRAIGKAHVYYKNGVTRKARNLNA